MGLDGGSAGCTGVSCNIGGDSTGKGGDREGVGEGGKVGLGGTVVGSTVCVDIQASKGTELSSSTLNLESRSATSKS